MAIVDDLHKIRDWLQEQVCDRVKLKAPDDEERTEDYDYQLVTPRAFVHYLPAKDRLPPEVTSNFPSLCIRLTEGEHRPGGLSVLRLMLHFGAWNPGLHARDIYVPKGQGYDQETAAEYQRTADGWQDVLSFVDTALREIESEANIAGYRLVEEEGVKYGLLDESLEGNYPYWFAWVSFTLQGGNIRPKPYDEML